MSHKNDGKCRIKVKNKKRQKVTEKVRHFWTVPSVSKGGKNRCQEVIMKL